MALRIRTVMTYPLNGSTEFLIPFEYLARKFVTVTLVGQDRKELVLNQDFRFVEKTKIQTTRVWTASDGYTLIEIRRFTSATERLVDFADGSILRAYDLNISQVQTLHVAEEARDLTADTISVNTDGHLDARGRRIVNVADPTEDYDAVNLRTVRNWNDGAYQSYLKAQQEATRATQQADRATSAATLAAASQSAAATSEVNSKSSETAAKASENSATASATRALASEVAANGHATRANTEATRSTTEADRSRDEANRSKSEADRAKLEADKLGNMNELGGALESVTGTTVKWRGAHWFKTGLELVHTEPFIDFHHNNNEGADYTHRLVADTADRLRVSSGLHVDNNLTGGGNWSTPNNITGGYVESATDVLAKRHLLAEGNLSLNGDRRWIVSFKTNDGQSRMNFYKDPTSDLRINNGIEGGGDFIIKRDNSLGWGVAGSTLSGDGNLYGTRWGGWLYDYIARTLLIEVAQGGAVRHDLTGQFSFETPNGHSITGWESATQDGSVRYTKWWSRQLLRRTTTSGWIACGRTS
jgi:hypothetical protein